MALLRTATASGLLSCWPNRAIMRAVRAITWVRGLRSRS
jgi:hypothetical protein